MSVELAHILTSGRVDYKTDKHNFILTHFTKQEDITGYGLRLTTQRIQPKALNVGKPRWRKRKVK